MTKKELLLFMLEKSWVYLVVDGDAPGVSLPDWVRQPEVTIQVGYNMPVPIRDLRVDDNGVAATLSFRQVPHACVFPWDAVRAMFDTDGRGAGFPVEGGITGEAAIPPESAAKEPEPALKKQRPSYLKLVP